MLLIPRSAGVLANHNPNQAVYTEVAMPRYEFYCEDCKKPFELILSLAEYEKNKIKCSKCGSEHVHQESAAFFTVTSKKS